MNVIKPTNTSGFCYKAVLRPLAACARPFSFKQGGLRRESVESGISYRQHNVSLCHVVFSLFTAAAQTPQIQSRPQGRAEFLDCFCLFLFEITPADNPCFFF